MTYILEIMAKKESKTYPVRFEKTLYEDLLADCEKERRSLAALMNLLGEKYLQEKGIYPKKK